MNNMTTNTASNNITKNSNIRKRLDDLDNYLKQTDTTNLNDEIKKIINNYIRLDNAYQIKHEELKNIYEEYKKLYNKCRIAIPTIQNDQDKDIYMKKLDSVVGEIRRNDEDMYMRRLLILGQIKGNENITSEDKDIMANKIMVAYRNPVVPYKPKQEIELRKLLETENNDMKINVSEIDSAYIQKHNELMQMYRAYKVLYDKTLSYKDSLEEYKSLDVKSSISRDDFRNMLDDQKFIMDSLDNMQDNLIKKDILRNDERVPTTPVISNVKNMALFNDNMKEQIGKIIKGDHKITNETKTQFDNILSSNNNDARDDLYREMILVRKK